MIKVFDKKIKELKANRETTKEEADRQRLTAAIEDLEEMINRVAVANEPVGYVNIMLLDTLTEGITSLRENEQLVVSLYYKKNLSMKEIAQVMEVSEPRISQIHSRAIQKLKLYMNRYINGEA